MSYIVSSIMDFLMSTNYIYNQSWEDGEVDLTAYELNKDSNVCMITTGGDNVLNYLAHGVNHVTTADMNKFQTYLFELKRAVIMTQPRENAMKILGNSDHALLMSEYCNIAKELSPAANEYWKKNTDKFKDFWHSGSVGIYALFLKFISWISGFYKVFSKLLSANGIEQQREIYWNNLSAINSVSWCCTKLSSLLIPFAGVPIRQFNLFKHSNLFTLMIHRMIYNQDFKKNYFYSPYVGKGWTDDCCPLYLQKDYYDTLKAKLHDPNSLRIVTARMDLITSDVKFNRIVLLDHLDWMCDDMIISEFANLKHNATDDCLYCWRSFSVKQPFACLRHLDYHTSEPTFDEKTNKPLRYGDRLVTYNSIHTARLGCGDVCKVTKPQYTLSRSDSLSVFCNMMIQPFLGLGLSNRGFMNHYYKKQAKHYDAYRQNMLHGKTPLMYAIPFHKMKDKKVLVLAGGTGDLLDYFSKWIPTMNKVVVSDISEPMIDVANKRIAENGWSNVSARIEDVLDDCDFKVEEENTYDLVILTYSLTMIPNWAKTIQVVMKYLKPGGKLGIADFVETPDQSWLGRTFFKAMFKKTHIHLNYNHIKMLQEKMDEEYLRIDEGGFPHVPVIKCPYYYGIFVKREDCKHHKQHEE